MRVFVYPQHGMALMLLAFASLLVAGKSEINKDVAETNDNDGTCENSIKNNDNDSSSVDYLIVGAGGSGLQTALVLQKYNLSYRILEKESSAGSFWLQFPRFDELISVNKWVRNETQRFRYDWHSFLEADVAMLDITEEYFPKGQDWHTYMNRVVEEHNLNIKFNTTIHSIATDGSPCLYVDLGNNDTQRLCANKRIFVGTGLKEKDEPYLMAMGGIPYSKITKPMARHKRVCVLGNGNSGFEVTQNLFGVADRVTIYGKESHRLSSVTRYTGDVRVKYLQVLENLHGKLLDTVEKFDYSLKLRGLEEILNETQIDLVNRMIQSGTVLKQFDCEVFVICTGFQSHVPGMFLDTNQGLRFPPTNQWYQSVDNPSVHYVGWLMHEADFQRGAGGFLSGYRYLIRNLINHIRTEDVPNTQYPRLVFDSKEKVIDHVIARSQVADDLIILQDGVVIRDAIVKKKSPGNNELHYYEYYEGISYNFHNDLMESSDEDEQIIWFYFAWGDGRRIENVFDNVLRYSDSNTLINLFIHPVLEINGMTRHLMEDLNMAWNSYGYIDSITKVVREALDGDLSLFSPKRPTVPYTRSLVYGNEYAGDYEEAVEKGTIEQDFIATLWQAVRADGNPEYMKALQGATKQWLPDLIFFQNEALK